MIVVILPAQEIMEVLFPLNIFLPHLRVFFLFITDIHYL